MPSTYRVTQIECPFQWLQVGDVCHHFGEYTSGGGYGASDTNQWIHNLKKRPSSPAGQLYWKDQAVVYWANVLSQLISAENVAANVTFITIPGSKPVGHPDYDPHMQRVLKRWARNVPHADIRPLLVQTVERSAQHEDDCRLTPDQLKASLTVDGAQLVQPLKATVVVVDDVMTLGASFKAAQSLVAPLPGVKNVAGLFLARTVWPNPFAEADGF
jgi:hypothetical protein